MASHPLNNPPPTQAAPAEPRAVAVAQQVSLEQFQGPLPHPDILQRYDEIVPGAAQMILQEFQSQSEHRRALEDMAVSSSCKREARGQWFALIIALAVIACSGLAFWKGYSAEAASSTVLTVLSLVYAFLYGVRSQRQERERKAQLMSGQAPPKQ